MWLKPEHPSQHWFWPERGIETIISTLIDSLATFHFRIIDGVAWDPFVNY